MLVILTTHPIQYQVPLWQAMARDSRRVPFEVWYFTKHATQASRDREFKKSFVWDLEMLSGYPHRFLDVDPDTTPIDFWKCRLRGSFAESFREAKAKAVWIQGWQVAGYWQAVWAARSAGTEIWLRGESNDLGPVPVWKRAIKRLVLGNFLRRVDRFLYIGKANRRLYEKFGVPKERLYSAPYAVDNERFARQAEGFRGQRSEIRSQWRVPESAFCVLFCGKFIPKKRPLDLVKAAQLLITDNRLPSIHLLFAGSGELGATLRDSCTVVFDAEMTQRSEIKDQRSVRTNPSSDFRPLNSGTKPPASFAGFLNQTEISKAYVAADCLVLPSDYRETWGLVVNEAMASGLPCIISNQCGCAEDLGRYPSNRIFSGGDVRTLLEQIVALSAIAQTGSPRANFQDTYCLENTVSTVFRLYQTIEHNDSAFRTSRALYE